MPQQHKCFNVVCNPMTSFKPDHRKTNVLFYFGILFLSLTYFTLNTSSKATIIVWTFFIVVAGFIFVGCAIMYRYIITIEDNRLIVKSRFGIRRKQILIEEINKIKVLDKEYPVTLYNNTILHLILWDKKFNRFKQIELYDVYGKKLFTID